MAVKFSVLLSLANDFGLLYQLMEILPRISGALLME
jgi:hypothetical protein